eukprot:TRINITY_DN4809_c0_g1_i1.p1 TRINITY_DN4809_c0_g1~~TRINITY_DN4809_c0_g1_i1.p1  ORF type:complete len:277 (+),score=34.14 TRINITY_DN4809_c0_g1_i1:42-872(+)
MFTILKTPTVLPARSSEHLIRITEKQKIIKANPLADATLQSLKEWFNVENTYHSNAIEGNTLTRGETALIIQYGMTVNNKPLKDHNEAVDLYEANQHLFDLAETTKLHDIQFSHMREIHERLMTRTMPYFAGTIRNLPARALGCSTRYPDPHKIGPMIDEMNAWLRSTSPEDHQHAVKSAADLHWKLAKIHPFSDGNGRMARLMCNFSLLQGGYTPALWDVKQRDEYISALEQLSVSISEDGKAPDYLWDQYYSYMFEAVERSLNVWLQDIKAVSK